MGRNCHGGESGKIPIVPKFLWRLLHNRLPTKDRLSHFMEGITHLLIMSRFKETVSHLFYNCPSSTRVGRSFPQSVDNPTKFPTFMAWYIASQNDHKTKPGCHRLLVHLEEPETNSSSSTIPLTQAILGLKPSFISLNGI